MRDGTKVIAPSLTSDASIQALYDNNVEHIEHIQSIRSIFKNEIYHYMQDTWLETQTLGGHTDGFVQQHFLPMETK